ncbi:hypothetical protein BMF94_1147 [Rhodotorula taiwanensis]|uniref:Major facilitator superfamily (MFS) profile domain-containing protein n=1 Tax=Rhodotorula taiwanensis TaxID=741276 RepID=A0A2S5BG47_9BASI|nr:hypothetical protein BMF94_1147 [Rhodotorula taiwanensis]
MPVTFHVNGAPIGGMAILIAVFSSMGGYDTGQIADFQEMDDFKLRFAQCGTPGDVATCAFSNVRTGLIVGMLSIGTLFGALFGASIADRLGRRKAIMIDCTVLCIGIVIQAASVSAWYQFMIGRLVAGLGVGALSAVVPLYQSEIAPKEIRGTLVCTYQLMITFGILVAYCICIGTRNLNQNGASWRIPNVLTILFALILGVGIIFAPESPRWLFFRGRHEEAELSLARVRGVKVEDQDYTVRQTYEEMKAAVEHEKSMDKFRWIDCFSPHDKILYRTVLLSVLQAGQQLTGANYFFYYGAVVFNGVGISDSFVAQIILGAVNFVRHLVDILTLTAGLLHAGLHLVRWTFHTAFCSILIPYHRCSLGLYIMERFGRRMPLILGGIWQGCWLIVYATAGTVKDPVTNKGIGKLEIVASCFFILGYASTWAPGIWTLVGETPRNSARAKTGVWNFALAFSTPFIVSAINYAYGYVFAGCIFAGSAIVFFFLYESAGLSLENVDRMYNDPKCKPWNSSKWVPEGHESRKDYVQALKAEEKATGDKPVHRDLAEDSRISHDGTVVGGTGSENPKWLKKHGRNPEKAV